MSVALARVRARLCPAKCTSNEDDTLSRGVEVARIPARSGTTCERVRIMGNGGVVWFTRSVKRFSLGPSFGSLTARLSINRFTREYSYWTRKILGSKFGFNARAN